MEEWPQVVCSCVAMTDSVSKDAGEICTEDTVVNLFTDLRADSDKDIATA